MSAIQSSGSNWQIDRRTRGTDALRMSAQENAQTPAQRGRTPRCIILAPTRELAKQVEREFQESSPGLTVGCYYGGAPLSMHTCSCPLLSLRAVSTHRACRSITLLCFPLGLGSERQLQHIIVHGGCDITCLDQCIAQSLLLSQRACACRCGHWAADQAAAQRSGRGGWDAWTFHRPHQQGHLGLENGQCGALHTMHEE